MVRQVSTAEEAKMQYDLDFKGYWRVPTSGVAPWPGVYCVYVFRSLSSYRVLYIGETSEVESELVGHRLQPSWKRVAKGHDLYFSAAKMLSAPDRKQAAAAMIKHYKPPCNDEYKDVFSFPETTVITTGENLKLEESFTVGTNDPPRRGRSRTQESHPC